MNPANIVSIIFPVLATLLFWIGLRNAGRPVWILVVFAGLILILGSALTAYLAVGTENAIIDLGGDLLIGTIIALLAGVVLALLLPGKRRFAALVIALVYPVLLWGGFAFGVGRVTPFLVSEESQPVIEALNRYRAQRGSYPDTLDQLVPSDLSVLNKPKSGWDWRYEKTGDSFLLTYTLDEFTDDGDRACVYRSATLQWTCLPYGWNVSSPSDASP